MLFPIHRCYFEFGHNVFKWRKNWDFSRSYAASTFGGGVTLDLCHDIDLLNLLIDVKHIDSVSCKDHVNHPGIDFLSTITLSDHDRGAYGFLNLDYIREDYTHRGFIFSSTDSIFFDLASGLLLHNSCKKFPPLTTPANRNKMFVNMIKHLFFGQKPDSFNSKNLPNLLNTKDLNYLIASIWSQRIFNHTISSSL